MTSLSSKNTRTPEQKAAIRAGLALIGMAILAPIAHFGILGSMVVTNAVAQTDANIAANPLLFVTAIICLVVVAILDIVVALALYRFFVTAQQKLSAVMAGLRLAYAALFALAIGFLVPAIWQAGTGDDYGLLRQIDTYTFVWNSALLLFAAHLVLLGWLFVRTTFTPTWLAPLLIIAGLGYGVDSIGKLFIDGYTIEVATVAFVGEVVLIVWLLMKGRKVVTTSTKRRA